MTPSKESVYAAILAYIKKFLKLISSFEKLKSDTK